MCCLVGEYVYISKELGWAGVESCAVDGNNNEYVQPVDGSSWIFLISQWPGLHFLWPTPFIETFLILILTLFYTEFLRNWKTRKGAD